jgi:AcrR family transcriptional regulator
MGLVSLAPQSLNGAARAQMSEIQRARMLTAAAEVVAERGYHRMSVARVTGRAGVSRRTFYDLFEDREDCFLTLFDEALARATKVAEDGAGGAESWRDQVRAGLSALLQFIGDEPVSGSLLLVGALGAGPKVLERRAQRLETLKTIVDRGRSQAKTGHDPPPLTAEGVVGAVLSVLHARLLEPEPGSFMELLNPLMAMIVLPYLGQAAATKELKRPVPKTRSPASPRPVSDPFEDLGMRLTYRTLRVLAAVAAQPGASNREVGEHAGIIDQGQMSRLLARLQTLGLIHNTGQGQTKGEPNAWNFTPKGQAVQHVIEEQTRR